MVTGRRVTSVWWYFLLLAFNFFLAKWILYILNMLNTFDSIDTLTIDTIISYNINTGHSENTFASFLRCWDMLRQWRRLGQFGFGTILQQCAGLRCQPLADQNGSWSVHRSTDPSVLEAGLRLLGYVALMGNAVLVKKIGGWYLREGFRRPRALGVEETRSNLTSTMTIIWHRPHVFPTCFRHMLRTFQ